MSSIQAVLIATLCFSTCFSFRINNFDQNIPSYTAAVVELNPQSIYKGAESVNVVSKQVLDIIQSKAIKDADIVVFPEMSSVLNAPATAFFLPNSTLFCADPEAHSVLQNISCAVRAAQKYVVIDLNIKIDCSVDDQPFCANQVDSVNLYNMAIVFNRQGEVIAKYRKYNLFNEQVVQKTVNPELTTFRTDFNVTFGLFICFDLMFAAPALNLIDQGVKHFVYPTMWSSSMPYLTATQFQQSWAYSNDVTLLAANVNFPLIKSSGSGIYAGRLGALKLFQSQASRTKILIAKVPIDNNLSESQLEMLANAEKNAEIDIGDSLNKVTDAVPGFDQSAQFQEDLTNYTVQFLNFTEKNSQEGSVCNNNICCNFDIEVRDNGPYTGKQFWASYSYAIAVFNGYRSYRSMDGVFTAQAVCSLVACTQMNTKNSCGRRIEGMDTHDQYTFEKLMLKTEFPADFTNTMPNTLTTQLQPLQPTDFEYKSSKLAENGSSVVQFQLTTPKPNLFTFAIFSRAYGNDINNAVPKHRIVT